MFKEYIDIFIKFRADLAEAFIETAIMMGASMFFSLIFGLSIGLLLFFTSSTGIYKNKVIYGIITLINIVRSIPFILFSIVMIPVNRFFIGTGFGVGAPILPLSLIGIATMARFSEHDFLELNKNLYETLCFRCK